MLVVHPVAQTRGEWSEVRQVGLIVAVAAAALLVWVGLQPAEFRVARSGFVAAPPAAVYAHVYDFAKWQAWSPWTKRDPNAKVSFIGPTSGPGAVMRWDGNDTVGQGAMAITEAMPPEALRIRLDLVRPFDETSEVGFRFVPEGTGTRVTWTMTGRQGFVQRLLATVARSDMDAMIGADYEAGLASLKAVAEAAPPEPAAPPPSPG